MWPVWEIVARSRMSSQQLYPIFSSLSTQSDNLSTVQSKKKRNKRSPRNLYRTKKRKKRDDRPDISAVLISIFSNKHLASIYKYDKTYRCLVCKCGVDLTVWKHNAQDHLKSKQHINWLDICDKRKKIENFFIQTPDNSNIINIITHLSCHKLSLNQMVEIFTPSFLAALSKENRFPTQFKIRGMITKDCLQNSMDFISPLIAGLPYSLSFDEATSGWGDPIINIILKTIFDSIVLLSFPHNPHYPLGTKQVVTYIICSL